MPSGGATFTPRLSPRPKALSHAYVLKKALITNIRNPLLCVLFNTYVLFPIYGTYFTFSQWEQSTSFNKLSISRVYWSYLSKYNESILYQQIVVFTYYSSTKKWKCTQESSHHQCEKSCALKFNTWRQRFVVIVRVLKDNFSRLSVSISVFTFS